MNRRKKTSDHPPRWVDLGLNWFEQYQIPSESRDRLAPLTGYLDATALALVTIGDPPATAGASESWIRSIHNQITRAEAEFCGRLLINGADLGRWLDTPDSLTWAVLAVPPPPPDELTSLAAIVDRGVRVVALDPQATDPQLDALLKELAQPSRPRLAVDLATPTIARFLNRSDTLLREGILASLPLPLWRGITQASFESVSDEVLASFLARGGLAAFDTQVLVEPGTLGRSVERLRRLGPNARIGLTSNLFSKGPEATPNGTAPEWVEAVVAELGTEEGTRLLRLDPVAFLGDLVGPAIAPLAEFPTAGNQDIRPAY